MLKCFWLQNMHVTLSGLNPAPFHHHPANCPPRDKVGGSQQTRSCLFLTPALDTEGLGVAPRHKPWQDEGPWGGNSVL